MRHALGWLLQKKGRVSCSPSGSSPSRHTGSIEKMPYLPQQTGLACLVPGGQTQGQGHGHTVMRVQGLNPRSPKALTPRARACWAPTG